MEILLWIVLALLVAIGVARYNESNKIFWILFTSFVMGIAGGSVYVKLAQATQSEQSYPGVSPTQAPMPTPNLCGLLAGDLAEEPSCPEPELVSQEKTPDMYDCILTPVNNIAVYLRPPRIGLEFFNTS